MAYRLTVSIAELRQFLGDFSVGVLCSCVDGFKCDVYFVIICSLSRLLLMPRERFASCLE